MKAILVLGTGRSGTSALAGCLQILGGFCGSNLRSGTNENQKGYFEDKHITTLNKYLLQQAGIPWYDNDFTFTAIKNIPTIKAYTECIKDAIKHSYGNHSTIVIKDPRLCLLLPCYQHALAEMGYEIFYVKSHRNDYEKAKSLNHTSSILNEAESLAFIYKYDEILNNSLSEVPHYMVVDFNQLLNETEKTLSAVQQYFPFLDYSSSKISDIKNFLDPSLKHF